MSYERYKDFRLAPDDNGCWSVITGDTYEQVGSYPSKASAKKAIDAMRNTSMSVDELEKLLPRCETKDTHDFPELEGDEEASCYNCRLWEAIEQYARNKQVEAKLSELKRWKVPESDLMFTFASPCNMCGFNYRKLKAAQDDRITELEKQLKTEGDE